MPEHTRRFETERTRRFRQSGLSERDERTISNVETFGCEVVQVKRNSAGPGWSYTLGVHDACGQPEVITVGLREETAHFSLNEAADRLRNGINLAEARHRDILGEVECEFRPVDPKWVRHLMGWAIWYYDGGAFPPRRLAVASPSTTFFRLRAADYRSHTPSEELAQAGPRNCQERWQRGRTAGARVRQRPPRRDHSLEASRSAPIGGLRFHDLRHQAITEMAEADTSDATMLQHPAPSPATCAKRTALEKLESGLMGGPSATSQSELRKAN